MIVYIIGPISGREDGNRAAFERARRRAEERYPHAAVLIPQDIYEPSPEVVHCPALVWCQAMVRCVPVARAADVILALPDWQSSAGARVEERERRGAFEVLNE